MCAKFFLDGASKFIIDAGEASGGGLVTTPNDTSGNDRHLTLVGSPADRTSPESKYGLGYDLNGTDQHLSRSNADVAVTNVWAAVLAFEVDALPSEQGLMAARNSNGTFRFSCGINTNGTIYYNDSGGSEVVSAATIGVGEHTITVRKTGASSPFTLVVMVDGVEFLNVTRTSVAAVAFDAFYVGSQSATSRHLDGGVYECRLWKDAGVPSQAVLDQIADPNDATYENTAEGNETALWFLDEEEGGDPGSPVKTRFT
jgi:hypothetical protein